MTHVLTVLHWSRNIPSNVESLTFSSLSCFSRWHSLSSWRCKNYITIISRRRLPFSSFFVYLFQCLELVQAGAKKKGIKWPLLCAMMLPCCLAKAVQRPTLFGVFWLPPSWGIFHRSPIRWSAWLVQGLGFHTPRLREPSHNPRSTLIISHRQFLSTPGCIRFSDLPLRCTVHSPVQCSSMGSPEEGILQRDRVQSDPGGRFLYFAFGSNLFADRIHINCPSAERVGPAKLFGKIFFSALGFGGWFGDWLDLLSGLSVIDWSVDWLIDGLLACLMSDWWIDWWVDGYIQFFFFRLSVDLQLQQFTVAWTCCNDKGMRVGAFMGMHLDDQEQRIVSSWYVRVFIPYK